MRQKQNPIWLTAKGLRSLSRLRGRAGVGVSPRFALFEWIELPPPASHLSMRCDLRASFARLDPRKRERKSPTGPSPSSPRETAVPFPPRNFSPPPPPSQAPPLPLSRPPR